MANAIESQYSTAVGALDQSLKKGGALDKESFMLLLITQFQHQDPLNPMEDKEFVAQLAQFSSLEQAMTTNENMVKLLEAQLQQQTISAVSYIGKEVLARGYGISKEGTSVSTIQYALNEQVARGFVNIFDATGNLLTTVDLPAKSPGIHDFVWDGKLSDGSVVPDGVYTIAISCSDASGQPIIVDTQVGGVVVGVSNYNGEHYLRPSDSRVVALTNVREVLQVKASDPKPVEPENPPVPNLPGVGGNNDNDGAGDGTGDGSGDGSGGG